MLTKRNAASGNEIAPHVVKNRRTTVKLPSALPPEPVQEEIGEEEDGEYSVNTFVQETTLNLERMKCPLHIKREERGCQKIGKPYV